MSPNIAEKQPCWYHPENLIMYGVYNSSSQSNGARQSWGLKRNIGKHRHPSHPIWCRCPPRHHWDNQRARYDPATERKDFSQINMSPNELDKWSCWIRAWFKPFLLKILSLKINFYLSMKNSRWACHTTRKCLELLEESNDSFNMSVSQLSATSLKLVTLIVKTSILGKVHQKTSLNSTVNSTVNRNVLAAQSTPVWWILVMHDHMFRMSKRWPGQQDRYLKGYAAHNQKGKVIQCRLCSL